ncbi:MAG: YfhO family protein, partial [Dehalococcoidia bacterium]|nr:YfhO family protein [Dehalococcoidia bacterium]
SVAEPPLIGSVVRTGAMVGLAGLTLIVAGRAPASLATAAVVLLTAGELTLVARPLLPMGDAPPPPSSAATEPLAIAETAFLERFFAVFPLSRYDRSFVVPAEVWALPNTGLFVGRRDVSVYDPLRLAATDQLVTAAFAQPSPTLALARLGVRQVITAADGPPTPIPAAAPRFALAPSYVVIADDAIARDRLFDPTFPAATTVILASAPSFAATGSAPTDSRASVTVVRDAPNELTLAVTTPVSTVLVVRDTFYPGWTATVNGSPAPILRADVVFRGVALAPGSHTVTMRYTPWSVGVGALVSGGVGAALIVGGMVVGWRRRGARIMTASSPTTR